MTPSSRRFRLGLLELTTYPAARSRLQRTELGVGRYTRTRQIAHRAHTRGIRVSLEPPPPKHGVQQELPNRSQYLAVSSITPECSYVTPKALPLTQDSKLLSFFQCLGTRIFRWHLCFNRWLQIFHFLIVVHLVQFYFSLLSRSSKLFLPFFQSCFGRVILISVFTISTFSFLVV